MSNKELKQVVWICIRTAAGQRARKICKQDNHYKFRVLNKICNGNSVFREIDCHYVVPLLGRMSPTSHTSSISTVTALFTNGQLTRGQFAQISTPKVRLSQVNLGQVRVAQVRSVQLSQVRFFQFFFCFSGRIVRGRIVPWRIVLPPISTPPKFFTNFFLSRSLSHRENAR